MGTESGEPDASPPHSRDLPAFWIDATEVTVAEYARFLAATGRDPPASWGGKEPPAGWERLPVTEVTWFEAMEYAIWAGKRLPTEAEWEKAARGTDGRLYPWGAVDDAARRNLDSGRLEPVGSRPQGASPCGALDMSGNAWEWTADWYEGYPGTQARSIQFGKKYKVLRGSAAEPYYGLAHSGTATQRGRALPYGSHDFVGFRCARAARPEDEPYDPKALLAEARSALRGSLREPISLECDRGAEAFASARSLPLAISGPPGSRGVLSAGLPFPRGSVGPDRAFAVAGFDGTLRPTQALPLARWDDGSLRWVLVSFPAATGETCSLKWGEEIAVEPIKDPLRLACDGERCELDAGAARFELGGEAILRLSLAESAGSGSPVFQATRLRIEIESPSGGETLVALPPERVEVEEAGPLSGRVCLRGRLGSAGGFRYDLRISASRGSPRGQLLLTLTHSRPREEAFRVREAAIAFLLSETPIRSVLRTESGWLASETSQGWVALGVRYFLENHPAELFASGEWIGAKLYAGEEPMEWEGGMAKTFELAAEIRRDGPAEPSLQPLRATAPPTWMCRFGLEAPVLPRSEEALERFAYWELLRDWSLRRWGRGMPTGFRHFGDAYMGGPYKGKHAYANLEYDVPFNFLIEYLRTGDRWYLDVAEPMVRHQADIDTNHATGQPWKHSPEHTTTPSELGHVFLRGLLLYHRLTGDARSLETARKIGDWIAGELLANRGIGNERQIGWSLYALAALYEVTRDEKYLGASRALAERLVAGQDARGKFAIRWDNRIAFFNGIAANGLLALAEATGDPRIETCVLRLARRTLGMYPDYACRTLHLFAWAAERTGDPRYLDALERTWELSMEFLLSRDATTAETHGWKFRDLAARRGLFPLFDVRPRALPEPSSWKAIRIRSPDAVAFLQCASSDRAPVLVIREGLARGSLELLDLSGATIERRALDEATRIFEPAAIELPEGHATFRLVLRGEPGASWQLHYDRRSRAVIADRSGSLIPDLYPRAHFALAAGARKIRVKLEAGGEGFHTAALFDPDGRLLQRAKRFVDFEDPGRYEFEIEAEVSGPKSGWALEIYGAKVLSYDGLLPYFASSAEDFFDPEIAAADRAEPGTRIDLARFGRAFSDDGGAGIAWDEPREIFEVLVRSPEGPLDPSALRLEWWGSVWPAHGSGGWMQLDDPWNGKWVRIQAAGEILDERTARFRFPPLSRDEWEKAPEKPPAEPILHRKTLKIRVLREGSGRPGRLEISAFGKSAWRRGAFDVELRLSEDGSRAARIEVLNGCIESLSTLAPPRESQVEGNSFRIRGAAGSSGGARLQLVFAETSDPASSDSTRVTVRLGEDPRASGFSFVPQDCLAAGALRIPDLGALVVPAGSSIAIANDPGPGPGAWDRSVRRRVALRPEATYESAMAGIPRLAPPRWVPLGVPSARQEVFVGPAGDWSFLTWSIGSRVKEIFEAGRDSRRIPFRKRPDAAGRAELATHIDTSSDARFDGKDREGLERHLEEGYLPWIHVSWKTRDVEFHEELGATTLAGEYSDEEGRRGDEPIAVLVRIVAANVGASEAEATVNLRYSHDEPIRLLEDGVVEIVLRDGGSVPEGLRAVRGWVGTEGPAARGEWRLLEGAGPCLRWSASLPPGGSRTLYVYAPFVDLLEPEELARLRSIRYEEEKGRILRYWKDRYARGMSISVPDAALENFFRANLWHNAITTDRDPLTGLYNHGVATVQYNVFANETVMVARSMDFRGEHAEAERYLEPLLRFQGREPLKGRFSSSEDCFHSAGPYTHGEYAMNHGFVLWGVAEHYLMTRDRAYLERTAPQLIRGCDFIARERRAPKEPPASAAGGLAPASSLEDVVEFQYWFATNGYFYLGMAKVAEALAAAGHPEAARIAREAEAYRRDIERAVREAATRAAAVPLRSGCFVPYVPSRVGQWRHLTEGWIREALYPALHLATAGVLSPRDPLVTWMLDDLEDNIFPSRQSGLDIADWEESWFEKGGITLQPCLLDAPAIYLARDEIPAALRAFWNTYAASIYPDVQCFAEWIPRLGQGGGPVYKTSDESRFAIWLRQLLIWEDGGELWLARGAPRAWLEGGKAFEIRNAPTFFGKAGLRVESKPGGKEIRAWVELPRRDPPRRVWLRLRHPEGKRPARVAIGSEELSRDRVLGEDLLIAEGAIPAQPIEVVASYD